MEYTLTTPCDECPFLVSMGFTLSKLKAFAKGEFACHKTCIVDDDGEDSTGDFIEKPDGSSLHCAGALIFNEKRGKPHQMARICHRLNLYDPDKLNMKAEVR